MRAFDFWTLMLCCLAWAGNFVIAAWAVGHNPIPPFFLVTGRALIVLACLGVFLFKPLPERFGRLLLVCFCMGPLHLGFLYTGLQTVSASWSAIIAQLAIPFATLLSVVFLKERIGLIRSVAIAGALLGTVVIIYEPGTFAVEPGLLLLIMAYVSMAVGTVLMRTVGPVDWRQYVAWTALLLLVIMSVATAFFETGQVDILQRSPIIYGVAAVYAGVFTSILAHGQYFKLLTRYRVSEVMPLTLIVPLLTAILGVTFLGDVLSPRVLVGALLILPCVFVIAKRQGDTHDQIPE